MHQILNISFTFAVSIASRGLLYINVKFLFAFTEDEHWRMAIWVDLLPSGYFYHWQASSGISRLVDLGTNLVDDLGVWKWCDAEHAGLSAYLLSQPHLAFMGSRDIHSHLQHLCWIYPHLASLPGSYLWSQALFIGRNHAKQLSAVDMPTTAGSKPKSMYAEPHNSDAIRQNKPNGPSSQDHWSIHRLREPQEQLLSGLGSLAVFKYGRKGVTWS